MDGEYLVKIKLRSNFKCTSANQLPIVERALKLVSVE
jgi:hypothetical protein